VDGDDFVLSLWCVQKLFAFVYASDSLVCTHVLFFEGMIYSYSMISLCVMPNNGCATSLVLSWMGMTGLEKQSQICVRTTLGERGQER